MSRKNLKIAAALLLAVALFFLARFFPVARWTSAFVDWVRTLGFWGALVYFAAYVLGTVLFVPGTALTLGSGLLFGVLWGTLLVSLASVTGATFAFLIARYVGREWTLKRIERYPKFKVIDQAIGERGFKLVLLMRLQPVFLPFAILNYALGLTRVRLRDYVLASWMGMLPATTLYVYVGSSLKSISDLVQGKVPAVGPWHELPFWGGLVLSAVLVAIFTRIAKQALQTHLGPEQQTLAKETE
jgi:uncharacterized membrane protein YdjX (TVP38/TMEM64 family)